MSSYVREPEPRVAAAPAAATKPALGPGRPLDGQVRAQMERGLGHSFAHVRIHDDPQGAALVESTGAAAATSGPDVAFAAGAFRPDTVGGAALLAHELAHVAQYDPSLPPQLGVRVDGALEADADRAAAAALVPDAASSRGVSRRAGGGLRLSGCNEEALRSQEDLLAEGASTRTDVEGQMARGGIGDAPIGSLSDRDRHRRLSADDTLMAIDDLRAALRAELAEAGSDEQRRAIQRRYLERLRRLRTAFVRQLEMRERWGIPFISGLESQTYGVAPHQRSVRNPATWSVEELNAIDAILSRMPPDYLQRARGRIIAFRRESGSGGSAAAAWEERSHMIIVYDNALERPAELVTAIVHEIGHTTYEQRNEQRGRTTFGQLPPIDWMALSDWKLSTFDTLATDLGVPPEEAQRIRTQLGGREGFSISTNGFHGVQANGRMVVADAYETGGARNRFFHYDLARNNEFVSPYARTHPGEDLAESFSRFMQNRELLRTVSQAKHDWMLSRHRQQMSADPASMSRCS